MSQSSRSRKAPEAPKQQTSGLGALAAVVVVALFVVLGLMLARPAGQQTAETTAPFAEVTPAAEATAATVPTAAPAADTGAAAAPIAADVAARADSYSSAPPMTIDPSKSYTATITTPRGDIVIKLRPDLAPQTVNSFVFLANEGFYDGVTWHRVLPNFMAQGGDPTGTGMGGPGYSIPGEFTDQVSFDRPGLVAMARSQDPNSGGSQFFITTAPAQYLDNQYAIFGEVVQGQEIVDGIPLRDPDQNPTTPGEQMLKVTVTEG